MRNSGSNMKEGSIQGKFWVLCIVIIPIFRSRLEKIETRLTKQVTSRDNNSHPQITSKSV